MTYNLPTEDDEQAALVSYLQLRNIKHFRVPSETYTTSMRQKAKNKRLGVVPGVPDLFCIVKGKLIAIEMKRLKESRVSPFQQEWLTALNSAGTPARVCRGWLEAKDFIEETEQRL